MVACCVCFFCERARDPRFSAYSEDVQSEARTRFEAHIENPKEGKALPSEYAVPVYKVVLKTGGQQEFDQVCWHSRYIYMMLFKGEPWLVYRWRPVFLFWFSNKITHRVSGM